MKKILPAIDDEGYIYVLSNPAFSDCLLKIGKSSRNPSTGRKVELYTTGVPSEFVLEYSARVKNHSAMEKKIHKALSAFRYSKDREFFKHDLDLTIDLVRQVINKSLVFEPHSSLILGRKKGCKATVMRERLENSENLSKEGLIVESRHPDGKPKLTRSYQRYASLIIEEEYFASGKIKSQKHFINDIPNGLYVEKYEDGKVRAIGMMLQGKKQGEWKSYTKASNKKMGYQIVKRYDQGKPVLCWTTTKGSTKSKKNYPSPEVGYKERNSEAKNKQGSFEREFSIAHLKEVLPELNIKKMTAESAMKQEIPKLEAIKKALFDKDDVLWDEVNSIERDLDYLKKLAKFRDKNYKNSAEPK